MPHLEHGIHVMRASSAMTLICVCAANVCLVPGETKLLPYLERVQGEQAVEAAEEGGVLQAVAGDQDEQAVQRQHPRHAPCTDMGDFTQA